MNTQIIKLEAWKSSIKDSLRSLSKRIFSKNSEVTVIIKESSSYGRIDEEQVNLKKEEKAHIPSFEALQQSDASDNDLEIRISNHDILPNVLISSGKEKPRRASLDVRVLSNHEFMREEKPEKRSFIVEHPIIEEIQNKDSKQESMIFKPFEKFARPLSEVASFEKPQGVEVEDEGSVDEITMTEDESSHESLFIVENKLNDALTFISNNRIFQLEQFLYDFKTRYRNMTERVQIKWRLLMAYCKENRKEYERASILYSQVLELAEESPKSLLVDQADIYHRLGICYIEIRKWNEGIVSFVKALKMMKEKKQMLKYGECMNNLGTLYLYADEIDQAEKCFLVSYEIKKKNSENEKKLISSLLNLYECNIATHNYEQAGQMLKIAESIVRNLPDSEIIMGGLLRRKGKLAFLKGEVQGARGHYQSGIELLQEKFPFCLDFGELMNNYAMLLLDEGKLSEAREMLTRSQVILNFYYMKDSYYIQAIKKNLSLVARLLEQPIDEDR